MSSPKKIAVIGSGIAGVTAAYQLALAGYKITIYDQERYPAMKTSYANGGQLSVCNSQTWNTWPMIYKGIKWITKKNAPFYISPSFDIDKLIWLSKFVSTAALGHAETNTLKTIKLALASRIELLSIAEKENIQFDHLSKGLMHIYTNSESLHSAVGYEKLMTDNGCEWESIESRQCMIYEPSLYQNPNLVGGIYTPNDSSGDIHKFTFGLSQVLEKKYGVTFCFGKNVIQAASHDFSDSPRPDSYVIIDHSIYDMVVIAAGCDSPALAKRFGDKLCIYPVKGYSITISLDEESKKCAPWISLLDDDAKIVCSRLGEDRLRIAGTAELSGYNLDIKQHRIKPLLDWINTWFPGVITRQYSSWAGLRPMTPNMMPIVGSLSDKKVWYHTGHGHLGWTLCAGTSKILAENIEKSLT